MYAKEANMEAVTQAIEHAENMAMMEICRVNLDKPSNEFDALLDTLFPNMQGPIQ
jgi:phosphopantetheinyl transferase (holo-ACP synthase)